MKIKEPLEFELDDGTFEYIECLLEFCDTDEERYVKVTRLDTNENITKSLTPDQMCSVDCATESYWIDDDFINDELDELEEDYYED